MGTATTVPISVICRGALSAPRMRGGLEKAAMHLGFAPDGMLGRRQIVWRTERYLRSRARGHQSVIGGKPVEERRCLVVPE